MIDVVAAIIIDGEKVLIARRANHKSLPGKWEFPGGKVEEGETPKEALVRELTEEFEITTEIGSLFKTIEHSYGDFDIRLAAYFTKIVAGNFRLSDHDKILWVDSVALTKYDLAAADLPIAKELAKINSQGNPEE
jgi:8-oxo-dGTP diphosphatase